MAIEATIVDEESEDEEHGQYVVRYHLKDWAVEETDCDQDKAAAAQEEHECERPCVVIDVGDIFAFVDRTESFERRRLIQMTSFWADDAVKYDWDDRYRGQCTNADDKICDVLDAAACKSSDSHDAWHV